MRRDERAEEVIAIPEEGQMRRSSHTIYRRVRGFVPAWGHDRAAMLFELLWRSIEAL